MSQLDPDALEGVSDEALLAAVPDGPITTVRDIQLTYGALYDLATAANEEYGAFLTPMAAAEFADTGGDSLIIIDVDVTNDEPQYEGVEAKRLATEDVPKLGLSYYASRGRGLDHSITHRTGQSVDTEKLARYAAERLTRWPDEDAVKVYADEELPAGNVLEVLHRFAEHDGANPDQDSLAAQLEDLRSETRQQVSGENPAIITVRLRTEPSGEFRWPVEVPELMGAMRAQYVSKLGTKNMKGAEKSRPAVGQGVDYATNEPATLVGMAEDPLAYYTSKQREKFPGLDIGEAWRLHQLSVDHAARLSKSKGFIDACGQRVFSTVVYYLPYFSGEPDAERLRGLYDVLYTLVESDREVTPYVQAYRYVESQDNDEDLRFYIAITNQPNPQRSDVFGETVAETTLWPFELARAHKTILDSPLFGYGGEPYKVASVYDSDDLDEEEAETRRRGLALLDHELEALELANYITSGWYLQLTHPEDRPKKDGQWQVTESDRRLWSLRKILAGESIAIESLLEIYVERLHDTEHSDRDTAALVMAQYAQWCALARCGLLKTERGDKSLLHPTVYMTNDTPTSDETGFSGTDTETESESGTDTDDGLDQYLDNPDEGELEELTEAEQRELTRKKRAANLALFIESSPMLRDDPERRGVFLLGAIIAQLSNFQRMEGRGSTLVRAFPTNAITPDVAQRAFTQMVDKNNAYMQQNNVSSPFYRELHKPLTEAFAQAPPDSWTARPTQLQFYYGMGIAYGQNASSRLDKVDLDAVLAELERLRSEADGDTATGIETIY